MDSFTLPANRQQIQIFVNFGSTYVEETWLKENFISVWNVFGEHHRTTNVIEGGIKNKQSHGPEESDFESLNVLHDDGSYFVVKQLQVEN